MLTKEQCIAVNDILVKITGQRISPMDIALIAEILKKRSSTSEQAEIPMLKARFLGFSDPLMIFSDSKLLIENNSTTVEPFIYPEECK